MDKKQAQDMTNDILIADALLRLKAIEELLVSKEILTKDELDNQSSLIADQLTKSILQKANVQGDLDAIVKELKEKSKT